MRYVIIVENGQMNPGNAGHWQALIENRNNHVNVVEAYTEEDYKQKIESEDE